MGALTLLLWQARAVPLTGVKSLVITAAPTTGVTGFVLVPAFTVELRTDGVATADASSITASIATGTGTLGGTLTRPTGGASTVTFGDLQLATGTGAFTITFTATNGYGAVTSSTVTIVAPGVPIGPTITAPSNRRRRRIGGQ